jgi:hypothetical protein
MKRKRKKEEKYVLTPKGFLTSQFEFLDVDNMLNALYVYMQQMGYNAILFNKGEVNFIKVKRAK